MSRPDITNNLVHWTKGDSERDAFDALRSIVFRQELLGSGTLIKGGYSCICFSEAPEDAFFKGAGRYMPFGVRVTKPWLFGCGGRPVIYQADAEFELLDERQRWRHMRYEPLGSAPVDFTWEREWRVPAGRLWLPPEEVVILLPDERWAEELMAEHDYNEDARVHMEKVAYGEWAALASPEPFHYRFSVVRA